MLTGFCWGYVCGLFLGWLFPETIGLVGVWLGTPGVAPWQLGAGIGFVGGAFKSIFSISNGSQE